MKTLYSLNEIANLNTSAEFLFRNTKNLKFNITEVKNNNKVIKNIQNVPTV